jgi:hypothetical protein
MATKPVRFSSGNIERLGNTGTSKDNLDSAFRKLLDLHEDVKRCLGGEEPQTEEMKKLRSKWRQ